MLLRAFAPPREPGLPPGYFLTIGYCEPKKNHDAIGHLARRFTRETFVVAGQGTRTPGREDPGDEHARPHGLGFVPQERLVSLLANCRALIFPSVAEGYGYPVAEALVAAKPVICYPIAPLTEFDHPLVHFATATTLDALVDAVDGFLKATLTPPPSPAFSLPRWPSFLRAMLAVIIERG